MAKLVVVSGPSGVGKTTVCDLLLQRDDFERVVTATTRAPRKGERHGVHYHFLDPPTFDRGIDEDRFLAELKEKGAFCDCEIVHNL